MCNIRLLSVSLGKIGARDLYKRGGSLLKRHSVGCKRIGSGGPLAPRIAKFYQ
jgi:hypothetical protein